MKNEGYQISDMGAEAEVPDDDYFNYAKAVAEKVAADPIAGRGILFCSSGVGMDITANKFGGIRSVLAMSPDHALVSRHDEDTNVLSLAADFLDLETAKKIVSVWLQTPFSNEERYKHRLEKLNNFEHTKR